MKCIRGCGKTPGKTAKDFAIMYLQYDGWCEICIKQDLARKRVAKHHQDAAIAVEIGAAKRAQNTEGRRALLNAMELEADVRNRYAAAEQLGVKPETVSLLTKLGYLEKDRGPLGRSLYISRDSILSLAIAVHDGVLTQSELGITAPEMAKLTAKSRELATSFEKGTFE